MPTRAHFRRGCRRTQRRKAQSRSKIGTVVTFVTVEAGGQTPPMHGGTGTKNAVAGAASACHSTCGANGTGAGEMGVEGPFETPQQAGVGQALQSWWHLQVARRKPVCGDTGSTP